MTPSIDLADRAAIVDLLYAYAWHFDRNEPESVAALFSDDATIDYGPENLTIVGRDAIVPAIRPGLQNLFKTSSHHITNMRIQPDGAEAATGVAYCVRVAHLPGRRFRGRVVGAIPLPFPAHGRRLEDRRNGSQSDGREELPPGDDAPDRSPFLAGCCKTVGSNGPSSSEQALCHRPTGCEGVLHHPLRTDLMGPIRRFPHQPEARSAT